MSRKLSNLEKKLTPGWIAALNVVGLLNGVWGATHTYHTMARELTGTGVVVLWLFLIPLSFAGAFLISSLPLGWILTTIKEFGLRLILVAVVFGVFLVGYGEPSIWLLGIAAANFGYVYWEYKKSFDDEEELEKL